MVGVGAGGAKVNSRGRSPRYLPPTAPALKGPRIDPALNLKVCLDQLGECASSEQDKRILNLKTVFLGPCRADVVGRKVPGASPPAIDLGASGAAIDQ